MRRHKSVRSQDALPWILCLLFRPANRSGTVVSMRGAYAAVVVVVAVVYMLVLVVDSWRLWWWVN